MGTNFRTEQSCNEIANALIRLMEKEDINKITILQICQEAGLSRRTFYRHFKTKDQVLHYKLTEYKIRFMSESNIENKPLNEIIVLSFDYYYRNRDFLILLHEHRIFYLFKELLEIYLQGSCLKEKSMLVKQRGMEHYFESFIAGSLSAVMELWVQNGFDRTPKELSDFVLSVDPCIIYEEAHL